MLRIPGPRGCLRVMSFGCAHRRRFPGVSSSQQIDDGAKIAFRQIVGSD